MNRCAGIALAALATLCVNHTAAAATRCVQPGGGSGCTATISAAVAAAAPGDVILVHHGTYYEDVTITKPLSIIGDRRETTILDASGFDTGFNVDGFGHPGLADVTITGFTIENANTEGVLVSNASRVRIADNHVAGNDQSLAGGVCTVFVPPDNPQGEGFDCGEAIHLTGVDHSIVASNVVEHNSGGVLISDDSGPTHDNAITGNTVSENAFDCGITLASHNPVAPNGVYHNTVAANDVLRNGLQGEGAGVGLFTPAPGTATYGNVVVGNTLVGNELPGIAMHSHAPNQNLNDNAIIGNYIAANGADRDDAETSGTTGINVFGITPITGTTISQNVIEREDIAVAVKTSSTVDIHFNSLTNRGVGVANLNGGTVDATVNYWGCPRGPGAAGCSSVSGAVEYTPRLAQAPRPVIARSDR